MDNIIDQIKKTAEQIAEKLGLYVYDVYFAKEGNNNTLHLEIDKKGGISLNEVEQFTDLINPELDKISGLDASYTLDCSSPGAERFLKKEESLDNFIGEYMEVTSSTIKVLGTLMSCQNDTIVIQGFIKGRKKTYEIRKADISQIQLRIKF